MMYIAFFIAGIILFIFGVFLLGKNLRFLLKEKVVKYLRSATKNPVLSTLFGALLTILNQSSTASSVLAVTLVGSGLLSFYSALGIIFGANIGTAVVVNFIAFGITKISFLFILVGFILYLIKKTEKIGLAVFYTGLAFFGLYLVSISVDSFKSNPLILNFLSTNTNWFVLLLLGIILTIITNSSAVTISTGLVLANSGLLSLWSLIFIILGSNIGTTSTTFIISFKGSKNAKRTAVSHVLFNIIGVILVLPILSLIYKLLTSFQLPIANQAALFHLIFNIYITIIFLILIKPFHKLILFLIPGKDDTIELITKYLSNIYIKTPRIALYFVKKEITRHINLAAKMVNKAFPLINNFDSKAKEEIEFLESAVNYLQSDILDFLDQLLIKNKSLNKKQINLIVGYSIITNTIERIGDRATNLAQIANFKVINKEKIPTNVYSITSELSSKVNSVLKDTTSTLHTSKITRKNLNIARHKLNNLKDQYYNDLSDKKYDKTYAITVSDFIFNVERIILDCEIIINTIEKNKKNDSKLV